MCMSFRGASPHPVLPETDPACAERQGALSRLWHCAASAAGIMAGIQGLFLRGWSGSLEVLSPGACQPVSHRLIHRDTCPVGGRLSRLPREADCCRQAAGHRVGPGSVGGSRGGHLGGGARIILTGARRALRGRQIVIGQPGQRPCSAAGAARKPDTGRPEEAHEKTSSGLVRVSSWPPEGQNGAEARKNLTWSPHDR